MTTWSRPNCADSLENRRVARRGRRRAPEADMHRVASAQDSGHGTERVSPVQSKGWNNNGWNERDRERNAVTEDGRGAGRPERPPRSSSTAAMRREEHGRQATSEGNKAQEGEAYGHLHKVAEGTDSSAEQGLEGPGPIGTTGGDGAGNGDGNESRGPVKTKSPRRQRSQRCDTAAGKGTPSKGEKRDARRPPGGDRQGASPAMDGLSGLAPLKGEPKRIEPQDRLQDATSLRIWWRSKPARSCETTRSERVKVQAPALRSSGNTAGTATRNQTMSMEGCGREPDESHERRSAPTDQGRSSGETAMSSRSNEERSS
jgi:hypothetical protein